MISPRQPVVFAVPPLDSRSVQSVFAEDSVRKAEFSGSRFRVPAAVAGVELLPAGRLWALGAVVLKASHRARERVGEKPSDRPEKVGQGVEKLRFRHRNA